VYPVSDEFLQAIDSNTRSYYWTGSIVTKNHVTYEFDNNDIVKGSGYITRQCCGSSEIELGTVYASELGITLLNDIDRYTLNGAQVKIFFHLNLPNGSVETVPMGIFEVTEANRNIRCLELKAYDYMLRFDKTLKLEAAGGTAYNFLNVACTSCKVEMAQTREQIEALPNGKETLGIYAENDMETFRDLLYYVAQVLGCVCQINREGKLELIPYSNTPIDTITAKERFNSTYSDFVTRYTAISSTNQLKEISEYYCIEPDDGLTINLGVNPLLQFGLQSTRARILNNILNQITAVEYVPFDSTTIGNPAFDPMDVLRFSGGHADDTKVSCITSITYNINGKHALKCVGKNPKLAAAKSKNDKNIVGLINQMETNKTVVYSFMNVSPYTIKSSPTQVLSIDFTSKESTTAMFLGEFLLNVIADEEERTLDGIATYEEESEEETITVSKPVQYSFTGKKTPELLVTYKVNGDTVDTFYPEKTCVDGRHILTLFYPLSSIIENSENTFEVYLSITGGTLTIGELQIRATISGQGLVAGIGDWNGRINITESFDSIKFTGMDFSYASLTDSTMVQFPPRNDFSMRQVFEAIAFTGMDFGYDRLNERVSVVEVVQTFTMDVTAPGEYDLTVIEINESDAFCLISDYTRVSEKAEINAGFLQKLEIDTTPFERVEKMEVTEC
jgi:hypothetical protein